MTSPAADALACLGALALMAVVLAPPRATTPRPVPVETILGCTRGRREPKRAR